MRKRSHELSAEDDAGVARVFDLLKSNIQANPYAWDGALAREIRGLPPGLRAMAATHHLDVSLTLDDIGWHFLNFGHPSHVEETERIHIFLKAPSSPKRGGQLTATVRTRACVMKQEAAEWAAAKL